MRTGARIKTPGPDPPASRRLPLATLIAPARKTALAPDPVDHQADSEQPAQLCQVARAEGAGAEAIVRRPDQRHAGRDEAPPRERQGEAGGVDREERRPRRRHGPARPRVDGRPPASRGRIEIGTEKKAKPTPAPPPGTPNASQPDPPAPSRARRRRSGWLGPRRPSSTGPARPAASSPGARRRRRGRPPMHPQVTTTPRMSTPRPTTTATRLPRRARSRVTG